MTSLSGDYPSALKLFEKGQTNLPQKREHDEQCLCGIARCSLKTGDIRRSVLFTKIFDLEFKIKLN
jgi:WD repeat-containing protein 19